MMGKMNCIDTILPSCIQLNYGVDTMECVITAAWYFGLVFSLDSGCVIVVSDSGVLAWVVDSIDVCL